MSQQTLNKLNEATEGIQGVTAKLEAFEDYDFALDSYINNVIHSVSILDGALKAQLKLIEETR